jgi:hypothetical protein
VDWVGSGIENVFRVNLSFAFPMKDILGISIVVSVPGTYLYSYAWYPTIQSSISPISFSKVFSPPVSAHPS